MNKNLIVKILIAILILVGAEAIFWFFKTTGTKKQIVAMINASEGAVAVGKVSVSGFPFSQKIIIADIKIQADAIAEKVYLPNKYQVNIKNLEITGGILANEFKARFTGPVLIQDVNGNSGQVEFKQEPMISFAIAQGRLQKLLYSDAGYKIVDEAKNSLYESGNSQVEFASVHESGKLRNLIKADFNDLEGLDIFTTKKIISLINPTIADTINEEGLKKVATAGPAANSPAGAPAASAQNSAQQASGNTPAAPSVPAAPTGTAVPPTATSDVSAVPGAPAMPAAPMPGLAKKAIHLEIEYVLAPKKHEAEAKDVLPNTIIDQSLELASVDIKNLEFSSPLYKITINGGFIADTNKNANSNVESCNITVRVEKIDNILTYIKTALVSSSSLPASTANVAVKDAAALSAPAPVIIDPASPADNKAASQTGNTPASQQADIGVVITDLAKKNSMTSGDISVFEIKKEKDNDFMINETPLIDLAKFFPAFAGNVANDGQ